MEVVLWERWVGSWTIIHNFFGRANELEQKAGGICWQRFAAGDMLTAALGHALDCARRGVD
jgi:hypothetical protein